MAAAQRAGRMRGRRHVVEWTDREATLHVGQKLRCRRGRSLGGSVRSRRSRGGCSRDCRSGGCRSDDCRSGGGRSRICPRGCCPRKSARFRRRPRRAGSRGTHGVGRTFTGNPSRRPRLRGQFQHLHGRGDSARLGDAVSPEEVSDVRQREGQNNAFQEHQRSFPSKRKLTSPDTKFCTRPSRSRRRAPWPSTPRAVPETA